jgi:hypothetical protein
LGQTNCNHRVKNHVTDPIKQHTLALVSEKSYSRIRMLCPGVSEPGEKALWQYLASNKMSLELILRRSRLLHLSGGILGGKEAAQEDGGIKIYKEQNLSRRRKKNKRGNTKGTQETAYLVSDRSSCLWLAVRKSLNGAVRSERGTKSGVASSSSLSLRNNSSQRNSSRLRCMEAAPRSNVQGSATTGSWVIDPQTGFAGDYEHWRLREELFFAFRPAPSASPASNDQTAGSRKRARSSDRNSLTHNELASEQEMERARSFIAQQEVAMADTLQRFCHSCACAVSTLPAQTSCRHMSGAVIEAVVEHVLTCEWHKTAFLLPAGAVCLQVAAARACSCVVSTDAPL